MRPLMYGTVYTLEARRSSGITSLKPLGYNLGSVCRTSNAHLELDQGLTATRTSGLSAMAGQGEQRFP